MILTDFDYAVPQNTEEAVALLDATPGSRLLAGGQSLLADLPRTAEPAPLLVDLRRLTALRGVSTGTDGVLRVGALTTLAELAEDPLVRASHPALAEAARANGDPQVRNRGTVGGNLAAGGRPTDLPVAAAALGARVGVQDRDGARDLDAEEFAALVATDRARTLLVTHLALPPLADGSGSAFEKIAVRATLYPLCAVAVRASRAPDGTLRTVGIAVTGSTPRPAPVPALEQALLGLRGNEIQVRAAVRELPADTFVPRPGVSREYLAHLTAVLTARALKRVPAAG